VIGPPTTSLSRRALERSIGALAIALAVAGMATSGAGAGKGARTLRLDIARCNGADQAAAPLAVQEQAIACLVNAARRQTGRAPLATPSKLRRAATIKGRRVVSCADFSHTPCGSSPTAAIRAARYRYGWFGENIFAGTWGQFTPRDVVECWLASATHRANILRRTFSVLGASRVRAEGVFGEPETAVWVATFASPR